MRNNVDKYLRYRGVKLAEINTAFNTDFYDFEKDASERWNLDQCIFMEGDKPRGDDGSKYIQKEFECVRNKKKSKILVSFFPEFYEADKNKRIVNYLSFFIKKGIQ